MSIRIIDKTQRIIEGDIYPEAVCRGAIVDYDAFTAALKRLARPLMVHADFNPFTAIGVSQDYHGFDKEHMVTFRLRISQGAGESWQQIVSGYLDTLTFAISSANTPSYIDGKRTRRFTEFDIHCLSLVHREEA